MKKLSFDPEAILEKYKPDFAMVYGSGAFEQEGYDKNDQPMIDFIWGVLETKDWHNLQLAQNPQDYSLLARMLGHKVLKILQDQGAGIYYHPYVDFEDDLGYREIKYGVISIEDLKKDLLEWTTLYCAGRLQKPVEILQTTTDVRWAIQKNLKHALSTALLLLPGNFTPEELFITIAGLSYTGDTRMKHAENPRKIENIVTKNQDAFAELYKSAIEQRWNILKIGEGQDYFERESSPRTQSELHSQLPENLRDKTDFAENPHELAENIRTAIADIVRGPSLSQSIKGIFSAGPIKSARYLREKRAKAKQ